MNPMVVEIKTMDTRLGWWGQERTKRFVFPSFDPDNIGRAFELVEPYEAVLACWANGRLVYERWTYRV